MLYIIHVFYNHESHLECNGILKGPKIQIGHLLYLVKPVYEGISVNIQLSGCLGNIQVILKELVYGHYGLIIEIAGHLSIKYFLNEHLAKRHGKLVDKTAYT